MKEYLFLLTSLLLVSCALADDNPAIEAMQEYMDFAEYSEGSISTEQLASIESGEVYFVDTRNKGQYNEGHIPGAVNIEWRQILARRDEIPEDKPVVLYCETGLLSSKAQFALTVAGRDNVKVLWGGYLMWSARQSFEEAQKQHEGPGKASQPMR
jgi:rhodanese-related sulfurtransferase